MDPSNDDPALNSSFPPPTVHTADASKKGTDVAIKVAVRVRPFSDREISQNPSEPPTPVVCVRADAPNVITVLDPEHEYQEKEAFEFDHVLWSIPRTQWEYIPSDFRVVAQENVFTTIGSSIVMGAMEGYNCSILAYGQTGSGKTHTMLGSKDDEGVIPRLVRRLFEMIEEELEINPHDVFSVELSFLEIYNEKVKDLLMISASHGASTEYGDCRVRFHPETGTYVEGLRRDKIENAEECLNLVAGAMTYRSVAATKMNAESSRSHAIFQLIYRQKSPSQGTQKMSVVNLVDLAGSERISMSGVTGSRLQEAKNINQSLSTLRRVIDILIENATAKKGKAKGIPPYRESMLTWILSDTLGGNSITVMIATVSPAKSNLEDTINTLRYALKAKAIVCSAKVNEERTAVVVGALRNEVDDLRKKLQTHLETQNKEGAAVIAEQLKATEQDYQKARDEQQSLERIGSKLRHELSSKNRELDEINEVLGEKQKLSDSVKMMAAEAHRLLDFVVEGENKVKESQATKEQVGGQISHTMARNKSFIGKLERVFVSGAIAKQDESQERQKVFTRVFKIAQRIKYYTKSSADLRISIDTDKVTCKATEERCTLVRWKWAMAHFEHNVTFAYEDFLQKSIQLLTTSADAVTKSMDATMKSLETYTKDKTDEGQFLRQKKITIEADLEEFKVKKQNIQTQNAESIAVADTKVQAANEGLWDIMEKVAAIEATLPSYRYKLQALQDGAPEAKAALVLAEEEDVRLAKAIANKANLEELVEQDVASKQQIELINIQIATLQATLADLEKAKEYTHRNKREVEQLLEGRGYNQEPENEPENVNLDAAPSGRSSRVKGKKAGGSVAWRPSLAQQKRAKYNTFVRNALYGDS